MKIKEVCDKFNIPSSTLHYYEKVGLLPPIVKNRSGVREYSKNDVDIVSFIVCMRRAGVSVESLISYMRMIEEGEKTVEARKNLLKRELKGIKDRIAILQDSAARLTYKIENYDLIMKDVNKLFSEGKE